MHVVFPRAQRARLIFWTLFVLGCGLITPVAFAAPDLKWDLSYRSALREHPIARNEFMAIWPMQHPTRLIHEKLASYSGEAIEASLLIERPDGDSGHPFAMWFIKTRTSAQVCTLYKDVDAPCKPLDPARADALVTEVINFKPMHVTPSDENQISDLGDTPILANYFGFLSVYSHGRALQRPIAIVENERIADALANAQMTDEELKKRKADLEKQSRFTAFVEAVRRGDIDTMGRLIDQGQKLATRGNQGFSAIAIAAGAGQQAAVSYLLQRGADIDAVESAALKAAVREGDAGMVDFLLSKGALIDPPKKSLQISDTVFETPLGVAVKQKDVKMARLLLRRGANVNADQAVPALTSAALGYDFPMMDLLIENGANPNQSAKSSAETALMQLMQRSGNLMGWPKESAEQKKILKTEAVLQQVVRKLLAAGADVHDVNSRCQDAYYFAQLYHSQGMMRLLEELGADPQQHARCEERARTTRDNPYANKEATARHEVSRKTRDYLEAQDYAGLEALYKKLNKETERTPSGVWKLAVFAAELKFFAQSTTDVQYWNAFDQQVSKWHKQFPKSVIATVFHAYALRTRALAHRGDGPGALVSQENADAMTRYAGNAHIMLQRHRHQAADHPEWCRAVLEVMPHIPGYIRNIETTAREFMRQHPYYHELHFTAAVFLEPRWGGSFARIDALAKQAAAASSAKEGRALYARIYWYLDQYYYSGNRSAQSNVTLFTKTGVDWTEMRAGFDDLVARYPDAWNLNAYAYFACRARDFRTMSQVLGKIGDRMIYSVWAGGDMVAQCLRNRTEETTAMR